MPRQSKSADSHPNEPKKKRSMLIEDEDDTEDVEMTQTQGSSTQAAKAVEKMSKAEFDRKVAALVRYLLFADRKKIPVKKIDLSKNVLKEHSKAFAKVMEEASKQIEKIFGLQVETLVDKEGRNKGYILVNQLESPENSDLKLRESDDSKVGLLMIIVSLIFMNEGSISDVALWHTLKKLGIEKDRQHIVFGDVEKLLNQDFVRQMYLDREKVVNPEGPSFKYLLGLRTLKEISKRNILKFVAFVYGNDIKSWKTQYKEVLEEEGQLDADVTEVMEE